MATRMMLGRCRDKDYSGRKAKGCGKVWTWPAGGRRRLGFMQCPDCGNGLSQTTHLVHRTPLYLTAAQADEVVERAIRSSDTLLWIVCKDEAKGDTAKATALYTARRGNRSHNDECEGCGSPADAARLRAAR